MRKKIVHLTSVHSAYDVRIFHKECKSLQAEGYDVTLIAQGECDSYQNDIKIISVKKENSRFKRMTKVCWQIYRKAYGERADLYHFHDPELILVGLLLLLRKKKVIYDVHEDVPRDILLKFWIKPFLRKIVARLVEIFEQITCKFFHGVVTVTPRISERFSHTNVIEVRNYPILNIFLPPSDERNFTLCYSGAITLQRGVTEMIQVAELCKTRLILMGPLHCQQSRNIIVASHYVNYLGYLDYERVNTIYNQSAVGLALLHPGPTFNNSLPIKLFEYMAAGLPVIASHFPLWRDIIEKYKCGFCVDPFDLNHIEAKIHFLKQHPEEAYKMGQYGRQAIQKIFNWSGEFKKLAHLYQQILSEG